MKKDDTILVKCNKETKKEFISLCKEVDTTASREIRRFMQQFIKENSETE